MRIHTPGNIAMLECNNRFLLVIFMCDAHFDVEEHIATCCSLTLLCKLLLIWTLYLNFYLRKIQWKLIQLKQNPRLLFSFNCSLVSSVVIVIHFGAQKNIIDNLGAKKTSPLCKSHKITVDYWRMIDKFWVNFTISIFFT